MIINDSITMDRLTAVLRLLASDFEVQKGALPVDVLLTDEIALLFDDLWQHCRFLKSRNSISAEQFEILQSINQELDSMSQSKELWTDSALKSDERWAAIRTHSKRALDALGKDYALPDIDWVQFVKA